MISASVVGATGYAGEELVRLLSTHPHVKLAKVTSHSSAGENIGDIYPNLSKKVNLCCEEFDAEELAKSSDVVFLSLPHGHSVEFAKELLNRGKKIIDLGADFRLDDAEVYEKWYSVVHSGRELLKEAVYGLTELNREKIKGARLIGNPGCYPTSIILGLAPVLQNRLVDPKSIISDSKSGISGAGKSAKAANLFTEISGNTKAYNIASHRHTPEINQELSKLYGGEVSITFTPHVVPMSRGILSTIYCKLKSPISLDDALQVYEDFYKNCQFIKVLKKGVLPQTKWVYGSNYCHIGLGLDEYNGRLIIVSAIDNLVKGAAGQAIQNMNVMFEIPEESGIDAPGLYL